MFDLAGTMTASDLGPEAVMPMILVSIPAALPMMAGVSPRIPISCWPAANDSFIGGPAAKDVHLMAGLVPVLASSSSSQPLCLATRTAALKGLGWVAIRISPALAREEVRMVTMTSDMSLVMILIITMLL